jgi:hemerythrin-like domain-containing protein
MQPKDLHGGLAFFFEQDHRDCDARWADVEELLDAGDIELAQAAWQKYDASMRRHLAMEDKVLFPAFEARSDATTASPVAALKLEHEQMEGLLDLIAEAIEAVDAEQAMDLGDTLLMLVQQHNAREEDMLYPEAEKLLAGEWDELSDALAEYEDFAV